MAPIRRVVRKGKVRWKVDGRAHGTGRRFFDSKSDAQRWLDSSHPETGLAEEAWSRLPVIERAKVIATWREITDAGLTVAEVWEAYRELVPVAKPRHTDEEYHDLERKRKELHDVKRRLASQ